MGKYFNIVCNKKAQIVLPAILLIPTVLLVIYLLFETTKISREKIRHQFALDTSAFVELTSTSHYLNATAYVNGAFPFRLFRENFEATKKDIQPDTDNGGSGDPISIFDLFYQGGAFPAMGEYSSSPKDTDISWKLHFYENGRPGWDNENPKADPDKFYPITSQQLAKDYKADWNLDSVKLYLMIYYFLSQIYEDQRKVYDRLTQEGEFFRKGYYFNVGNCKQSECGREGAKEFKGFTAKTDPIYIKKISIFYKDPGDGGVKEIKLDMEKDNLFDGKLFQFAYLSRGYRDKLKKLYTGIEITQPFNPPSNYFNVGLAKYKPRTHVRVALQCTREDNNCVWPDPTPKYQVRLFP